MKSKKWIKIFLIVSSISFCLLSVVNYLIDPFNIFHTKLFKTQFQMNERFMKVEFLEKNNKKFNAYMFGSSRIGTTDPSVIEKYIPNSKFYNFTVASANLYDYEKHLNYFVKKGYPLKTLYLQLDISHMENYGRNKSDYLRKLHPFVLNESLNLFYMQYLNGFFPFNIRGKIEKNFKDDDRTSYFLGTGIWTKPDKKLKMINDCKKFVSQEGSFNQSHKRTIKFLNIENSMNALSRIKNLADENNIQLYVFTTPHNNMMMDKFKTKYYLEYLNMISKITDFYDFSGYNTITLNNCNYYESSHYRPKVAPLIAARIFNDKTINIPNDFGVFVTKDNINEHLKNLEHQIENHDKSRNILLKE